MNIPKTKDRMLLGILAGGLAFIVQSIFDYTSYKLNISKRPYWTTAAGVWVSSRRQAKQWSGQMLGAWMTFGLNAVNGIFMVWSFTKAGLNKWPLKGIVLGSIAGSITNALLSGFAKNKVSPKDSNSTLSYSLTNAVTGFIASWAIVIFGDKSLFNERRVIANNAKAESLTVMPYNDSSAESSCPTYLQ
ncbi:hypothetical protein Desaci_1847 [Desulfosporosinus acidiphilus SJ4]|uniref:Uncharacterized protein n=1 Tax=Desulfosporosinus acidiphilus (strain DSM 22704 / JCM 16185 / SJ4) TaxID=646529 RepID=I4D4V3_DESAJ|nr:hypothetical protein [Desulfosporosinus acidiphilus]AFM40827.1 hypothetical protein Desaci_1847 [Desulfosporosinus acidiphilus SJ4]